MASAPPDKSSVTLTPGRRWAEWVAAAGVILVVSAVRLRLAATPLERDEGEYAYAGQLMLRGLPPYAGAYNMKFPGTYAAYAIVMAVFGQTATAVHAGTTVVVAANTLLVFALAKRWGGGPAVVAAAAFAVLATEPAAQGLSGHATHVVLLPALAGLLVLTGGRGLWRAAVAGALLATAVLMKQPGAAFVLLGLGLILAGGRAAVGRAVAFVAGAAVPAVVTVALLWRAGVLGRFWFWTVRYASQYGQQVPPSAIPASLFAGLSRVLTHAWPVWVLAAAGLAVGWRRPADRPAAAARLALLAAGVVAASAGFYYRPHYFILMMPGLALSAAAAVRGLRWMPSRAAPWIVAAVACGYPFVSASNHLFRMDPVAACRDSYPGNPFVESPAVAAYLRSHTTAEQTVAVFGSEPQIYFCAGRRSATGYVYAYPLMEPQPLAGQMQREMAAEVEAARPAYVVMVRTNLSWLIGPASDRWILDWCERYVAGDAVVGVVDLSVQPAVFYWDGDAGTPAARAVIDGRGPALLVYRRTESPR